MIKTGAKALLLTAVLAGCGGSGTNEVGTAPQSVKTAALVRTAAADEYDTLRASWLAQLTGGTAINTADPDIAAQTATLTANAQAHWSTMNTAAGRTALWSDLATWSASTTVTTSYSRLYAMALAYATTGSTLQGNAALGAAIVSALDWMQANHYGAGIAKYNNWWDWEIGSPQYLNDIMVLMYDQLSAAQRANYLAAIDYYCPDPTKRTGTTLVETGANRLDKAAVVALRGVLGKSSVKLAQARDAISQALLYVTSGDGFYKDGSFIQHTNVAYTGSYGLVMIADISRLFYLLNGSTWAVTDPNAANVYDWVANGYKPFVYQGAMMDAVRGRAISRQASGDHDAGRSLTVSLARLAQGAPASEAASLRSTVKHWMQRDTSFANYYANLNLYDIANLKAILGDAAVTPDPEQIQTHVFASMDRVLHSYPGYSASVAMFSNRIAAFESGNGENIKGWFTGIGMTYLYNADLAQFSADYWPTVDQKRLPGTTTDGSGSGTPGSFANYPNLYSWVGGSEVDNLHATAGMQFSLSKSTGTTLQGKKSWFLFGDKIIALGSNIGNTDGRSVETIVENRKLNAAGNNALTINGIAMPTSAGWSATSSNVQWAHLAGSVAGSSIGYYFPTPASVAGLRETRSGNWQAINTGQSAATVSNSYLSLALNHGAAPVNASYAYVVLPNLTTAQMASFAASPTVSILENSADAHAAKDSQAGVVGVNFWNDAAKTVYDNGAPYLSSNKKASVTTRQAGSEMHIGVADPTQANTGSINIELQRSAWQLISADPGVTVTQMSPTIKLTVNVNGSAGKTYGAKFALATTVALTAVADAYVQNGASAGTNFGTGSSLLVKNDGVGYARQSYLKFDLSSVPGTVSAARLVLMPTSDGVDNTIVNQATLLASDGWSETALTWNNQPAATTVLGSWTVAGANQSVALDVTSAAIDAMATDRLISMLINSPNNYGANGWVYYGARENGTMASRPTLLVTYH
ncbi:MAG: polysaccharide lyase family 8 super-sandwich domain-containing protein [Pseudomonadota bacterium]